jgi:hypothetical protein
VAAVVSLPAAAQVGHAPQRSPYRDLEYSLEWTLLAGYYSASPERLDVAPKSGPMVGARWDWRVGGPAYLWTRAVGASLEHRIIDPSKPAGQRFVGSRNLPLLFADAGLGLSLTGFKTWRGLVPLINAGVGTTADVSGRSDVAKYRFGVPFTLTYGAALKLIPGGQWQFRADWTSYLYQISYPESYFLRTGTDDPVLLPNAPRRVWRRNSAFLVGLSYLYRR